MTNADRIAHELSGGDITKFRAAKKQRLEDVYKNILILKEKADLSASGG